MKKNIKLLLIIVICFLMCGCVNYSNTLTINPNGQVDMKINFLVPKYVPKENNSTILNYIRKLKNCGYTVNEITDDSYYDGYEALIIFGNINELSTNKRVSLKELNYCLKDRTIFRRTKGLFKDLYTLKINIPNDSEIITNYIKEYKDNMNLDSSLSYYNGNYKFIVNLPNEVVSSNAMYINNENKTLTWDVDKMLGKDMEVKFYLYNNNLKNIIIFSIVLLFIVIFLILIIKKRKKSTNINKNFKETDVNLLQ